MSLEDQVRRQMEVAAAQQHSECPMEEDVDAAFGFREMKKELKKKYGVGTGNYSIKRLDTPGHIPGLKSVTRRLKEAGKTFKYTKRKRG